MYRIGEFARLGAVSIRMLRHYDELGLVCPAHVDPDSGYRPYEARRLRRLTRLVALRDLGFGLKEAAGLLGEVSAGELRGMPLPAAPSSNNRSSRPASGLTGSTRGFEQSSRRTTCRTTSRSRPCPPSASPRSRDPRPGENTLVPATVADLTRLGISHRERSRSTAASRSGRPARHSMVTASGRTECSSPAASNRAPNAPKRWLQKYRPGTEGRISHLKRCYGLDRSALKATKANRSGTGGRSWPTTLTRSPSASGETLPTSSNPSPFTRNGRALDQRGPFVSTPVTPHKFFVGK
jgi:DNA-binding transcriptional MerR regulator